MVVAEDGAKIPHAHPALKIEHDAHALLHARLDGARDAPRSRLREAGAGDNSRLVCAKAVIAKIASSPLLDTGQRLIERKVHDDPVGL